MDCNEVVVAGVVVVVVVVVKDKNNLLHKLLPPLNILLTPLNITNNL